MNEVHQISEREVGKPICYLSIDDDEVNTRTYGMFAEVQGYSHREVNTPEGAEELLIEDNEKGEKREIDRIITDGDGFYIPLRDKGLFGLREVTVITGNPDLHKSIAEEIKTTNNNNLRVFLKGSFDLNDVIPPQVKMQNIPSK